MNKEDSFKEKFKQALISTVRVISKDYQIYNNKKDIGIVKGVQAITWLKISLFGESNHAGTTPLKNRQDPMLVFGKINNYITNT